MSKEEHADYDSRFEEMRQNASEAIGDLVVDLANKHEFHAGVVVKILHSALEHFDAYLQSCPGVCPSCAGPMSEGSDEDEEGDEDSDPFLPVGYDA